MAVILTKRNTRHRPEHQADPRDGAVANILIPIHPTFLVFTIIIIVIVTSLHVIIIFIIYTEAPSSSLLPRLCPLIVVLKCRSKMM